MIKPEVCIIGCGPIGLSSAILLARQGIKVLLLERRGELNTHPRSRFVDVNTMELMRDFGLSMGTLLGTPMLAERDDVCAAVLGLAGTSPEQPHGKALAEAAAAIDAPLLFLMQMQDEMIQREHALALFDGFASPDKRLHAHPGRHAYLAREEMDYALAFILSHAEGEARPRELIEIADYAAQAND